MSLFNDLPPPETSKQASTPKIATGLTQPKGHASPREMLNQDIYPMLEETTKQSNLKDLGKQVTQDTCRKRSLTDNAPTEDDSKQRKVANGLFATLKSYVAERKGERDEMQDAHVLLDDCTDDFPQLSPKVNRVGYFAVFDGHGGARASLYASQRLHVYLSQKLPKGDVSNFDKELKMQIIDSFKKLDEEFLKEASQKKPVWKDGTTACCVLVLDDTLYIANLGDSKAILCRYKSDAKTHVPLSLSKEHNPSNYEERMRIQKAGGTVREGRVLGILEVSRSLGDGQYKRSGVINVPDVKRCQLNASDRFILIACDGLWKVFSPEQSIEFILQVLLDDTVLPPEGCTKTVEAFRYETACNKLASEAVRKGSADNVTVLLISIHKI